MSEDKLPTISRDILISAEHTYPSLMWLQATRPDLLTPVTLEKGGMTMISFRDPDGKVIVATYRTLSKYIDGSIGVQDEIHPEFENRGVQYNFEYDKDGNVIQYSPRLELQPLMQRCVSLIQNLANKAGSSIVARNKDYGIECDLVSDGIQWLPRQESERLSTNNDKRLNSGSNDL